MQNRRRSQDHEIHRSRQDRDAEWPCPSASESPADARFLASTAKIRLFHTYFSINSFGCSRNRTCNGRCLPWLHSITVCVFLLPNKLSTGFVALNRFHPVHYPESVVPEPSKSPGPILQVRWRMIVDATQGRVRTPE